MLAKALAFGLVAMRLKDFCQPFLRASFVAAVTVVDHSEASPALESPRRDFLDFYALFLVIFGPTVLTGAPFDTAIAGYG